MDCIKLASYLRVPPLGIPWSSNSSALSRGKDVGRFLMIAIRIWAFNHFFIAVFIRRRIDRRSQLSDFQALLQTDWLERAWTFQELILSPEPIIVCGTRHLEWKTWYQGLDYQNASPDHDRWAQENYEYAYWIRRHPRYLLPDYVVQPWRDLMVVWTAAPRPIGFCTKKNPKDSGNRDDD
ncbi:MAG: hypothetical protein MMC23_003170 [Stictis urceolatum]|nr:hypothetical protein [Stictis urceolata]